MAVAVTVPCMARESRRGILAGAATLGVAGCIKNPNDNRVSKAEEHALPAPEQLTVTNELGDETVTGDDRSNCRSASHTIWACVSS